MDCALFAWKMHWFRTLVFLWDFRGCFKQMKHATGKLEWVLVRLARSVRSRNSEVPNPQRRLFRNMYYMFKNSSSYPDGQLIIAFHICNDDNVCMRSCECLISTIVSVKEIHYAFLIITPPHWWNATDRRLDRAILMRFMELWNVLVRFKGKPLRETDYRGDWAPKPFEKTSRRAESAWPTILIERWAVIAVMHYRFLVCEPLINVLSTPY